MRFMRSGFRVIYARMDSWLVFKFGTPRLEPQNDRLSYVNYFSREISPLILPSVRRPLSLWVSLVNRLSADCLNALKSVARCWAGLEISEFIALSFLSRIEGLRSLSIRIGVRV